MYLLLDIGGSKMRIAVSSNHQTISTPQILATPQNFDQALGIIKDAALSLGGGQPLTATACGIAGVLDPSKSILVNSPHIKGWTTRLLKEELQKVLQSPVYLENDAALGGLGEAVYGAGAKYEVVAYLTIGTGVGGARVVKGRLERTTLGFEPGHQIIEAGGASCPGCSSPGHLEAYISGTALEILYHQKSEDITDQKIWDSVARRLAIGLNNVAVFWSPSVIVLGGSVMSSISVERVKYYLKELLKIYPTQPEVVKGVLDDVAGLYGGLSFLKQNII